MLADPHCGPPYFTAAEHLTLRSLTYWYVCSTHPINAVLTFPHRAHRYPNLHRMVSLYLIMCVRKLVPFTDAEMAIKQYISDEGVHSLGTATYNRQQMRKWGAVLDMSGILTWDQTFRESAHVQGLLLNLSQHRRGLERLMTEHPPSFNYDRYIISIFSLFFLFPLFYHPDRSPEDDYSFLEEEDDEAWLTVHVTGRVIALPKPPKPPTPTKKTAAKQPARKKVNHNAPLPPQV